MQNLDCLFGLLNIHCFKGKIVIDKFKGIAKALIVFLVQTILQKYKQNLFLQL